MLHNTTSYTYLLLYILSWLLVCFFYYKKVKITSGLFVIGSYFIYGLLAFLLYKHTDLGHAYSELKLFPFIYLFTLLYIFLIPVFKYEKAKVSRIVRPNDAIVLLFLVSYAVCAIIILPNILGSLREGLLLLILDSDGGSELYHSSQESYMKRSAGVSGIYGIVSIFYNTFSDIVKFLFFYYLTFDRKKKILIILFIIVLLIDLLYPISKGSRTDVIMNLFSIVMALTLFYPYYTNLLKKRLKRISVIFIVIISIPFMALTISRFSERTAGTAGGILTYAGQAPLNFNLNALDAGGTRKGDRTINLFKQFVIDKMPEDIPEVRDTYSHLKMDDSIFSTYVGDFVLDFGPIGAFVIFVFLCLYFNTKVRVVQRTISFKSLLIVYFLLCVAMQGGMYLFYYSFMENLQIMAFIFTYLILSVSSSSMPGIKRYLYRSI